MANIKQQAAEWAAATPPLATTGMTWFGYPVADWVQVLMGIWIIAQLGWFVWVRFLRKDKNKEE